MDIWTEVGYVLILLTSLWGYWSLLEIMTPINYDPVTMGWKDLLLILSGIVVVPLTFVVVLVLLNFRV